MHSIKTNLFYGIIFAIIILQLVGCEDPPLTDNSENVIEPAQAEAGPIQLRDVSTNVQLNATDSTGTDIRFHWTLRSTPTGSTAQINNFESATPSFCRSDVY